MWRVGKGRGDGEEVGGMTENEWTKSICGRLREHLKKDSLFADTLQKIPYPYSRVMEEMLHNSRNKNRKHYYMLQRNNWC